MFLYASLTLLNAMNSDFFYNYTSLFSFSFFFVSISLFKNDDYKQLK